MVNRQQWGIGRGINRQIKIGRGIERDQGIDRKINTGSESRHGLSRLSLSLGEWTRDRPTGGRRPPLYDLECLRQHPHLERGFTVSNCEDAQPLGNRGWVPGGIDRGRYHQIGRGIHKPPQKRGR